MFWVGMVYEFLINAMKLDGIIVLGSAEWVKLQRWNIYEDIGLWARPSSRLSKFEALDMLKALQNTAKNEGNPQAGFYRLAYQIFDIVTKVDKVHIWGKVS